MITPLVTAHTDTLAMLVIGYIIIAAAISK